MEPIGRLEVGVDATALGRVRSKGVIPTRRGLRIFQAVIEDDSGMITVAWPGQPWLDRKLREGDTLLVTGPVKFFHGRQIQPREFTILSRGDEAPERSGVIYVTYPASEIFLSGSCAVFSRRTSTSFWGGRTTTSTCRPRRSLGTGCRL